MWPPGPPQHPVRPVEADRGLLGALPVILWGSLLAALLVLVAAGVATLYCCWLLPRRQKHRCSWPSPTGVLHSSAVLAPWGASGTPWGGSGAPGRAIQTSILRDDICGPPWPANGGKRSLPRPVSEFVESADPPLWKHCPLYASSSILDEMPYRDTAFRTRSLPSCGRQRQRPISTTENIDEIYAKVNFSKKRRNRMRNDEAAVIALSRSRSQCLAGGPLSTHPVQLSDNEAVVVYDERTAL